MKNRQGYDLLAAFYNKYWTVEAPALFEKVLKRLVLPSLPVKGNILDLCCGTGQICARLSQRLYQMTGIDSSAEMLAIAKKNAPAAFFSRQDARSFVSDIQFDAVLSLFDSINHFLTAADLQSVFCSVRAALKEEGMFVFDVNDASAFDRIWEDGFSIVEDDSVCIVKPTYDKVSGRATYHTTLFRASSKGWKREDVQIFEQYYSHEKLLSALAAAGFHAVRMLDGEKDLKIKAFKGRTFFVAN